MSAKHAESETETRNFPPGRLSEKRDEQNKTTIGEREGESQRARRVQNSACAFTEGSLPSRPALPFSSIPIPTLGICPNCSLRTGSNQNLVSVRFPCHRARFSTLPPATALPSNSLPPIEARLLLSPKSDRRERLPTSRLLTPVTHPAAPSPSFVTLPFPSSCTCPQHLILTSSVHPIPPHPRHPIPHRTPQSNPPPRSRSHHRCLVGSVCSCTDLILKIRCRATAENGL